MASCVKCGRHPLRKDRHKQFRCARCGPRQTYQSADMSAGVHQPTGAA